MFRSPSRPIARSDEPRVEFVRKRVRAANRLEFLAPLMPTLVEKPPEGDGWIHDVEFDGYRAQIVRDAGGVRIFTRWGLAWTSKYRDLAKAAGELKVESAIIDGEINPSAT